MQQWLDDEETIKRDVPDYAPEEVTDDYDEVAEAMKAKLQAQMTNLLRTGLTS